MFELPGGLNRASWPDGDERGELIEERRADSFDLPQVLQRLERSVCRTILHDTLGVDLPDPRQAVELRSGGGVDVQQRRLASRRLAVVGRRLCGRRLAAVPDVDMLGVGDVVGKVDL